MDTSDLVPERLRSVLRCMNWCVWPNRSERRRRTYIRWNRRPNEPTGEQAARRAKNRPHDPPRGDDPATSNEQRAQTNTTTEQQDSSRDHSHPPAQLPDWAPDWVLAYLSGVNESGTHQTSRAEQEAQLGVIDRGRPNQQNRRMRCSQRGSSSDSEASGTAAFEMEDLQAELEEVAEADRAGRQRP